MKTIIYKLLWSFSIVLLITSCSKEDSISSEPLSQNQSTIDLKSIASSQGVLKFNSHTEFENTLKELNGKSTDFILNWNKRIGIRSQKAIFQEIIDAENIVRDKQAASLDPDITLEQFLDAGLTWDHSPIYNEYIKKGLIIEMTDPDGCKWFNHNALNPNIMPVLNEQGFVMINDTLYQFTSNKVKFSPQGSLSMMPQLANADETNLEQNIFVINYTTRKKTGGDWGHGTGWVEDPDESDKRVSVEVFAQCPDFTPPQTNVYVTFYLEIIAHKKVLFWWNYRNNYTPITQSQGSWSWYERYDGPNIYDSGTHYYTYPAGDSNHGVFAFPPNGYAGVGLWNSWANDYNFYVTATGYQTSDLTVDMQ